MNFDASEARHLDLIRFAHAAGTAFGYEAEDESPAPRFVPAVLTIAAFATVVAATLTYWI